MIALFKQIKKTGLEKNTLAFKSLNLLLQIIPHYFSKQLFPLVKADTESTIDSLMTEDLKLI